MTSDTTPIFSEFKDAKKLFFKFFFLLTYPQVHYPQSFCYKIFLQAYFSPSGRGKEEGKGKIRIREDQQHADPADPDPQHCC